MRARAILFDALGTLLELEAPAPRLCCELADRYGVRISEDDARHAMAAEIAFYRGHLDEGRDPESLAALREACAAELRRALPEAARRGLPAPRELVETLLASLRFHAYPDAEPALRAYRARGLRLVVVSNWDVSLHAVLANVGLSPFLDAILTAAEAGVRKPDPAIFTQALRLAGVSAVEALHVGDSLEEDVAGARAAGIEPVLVSRGAADPPEGLRTVTSLAQLPPSAARRRISLGAMDEGPPVAYQILDEGVTVFASDGSAVATVDHVVAAPAEDIFHGLVIKTGTGQRFVAADQVASLHERGVDLRLSAEEVAGLPEPHGGAPSLELRDPTAKTQRTRWKEILDMVSLKGHLSADWKDED